MALTHSLLECGHDEDRNNEVCSYCASERKLQPALYFCYDCGVYGKFLCGKCLKDHNKFIFNHEVENIGSQSTSRRTKDNGFKLKALQQSNDELQSENKNLQNIIKEITQKNVKLSEELRDSKIDLDRATAELKIKTGECKRVSKRWNENRRLIVKDRDHLNAGFMKKSNKTLAMIIATIDFGTTGTSWAFAFNHDLSTMPTKVHTKTWSAGRFMSSKASTSVLIHPDGKTFHSFGYEAEDKYAYLVVNNEHTKWFFFKHFNMNFDDRLGIVRNIMFEDVTGKQLEAKTVYALSIKYLKDDMMRLLKQLVHGDSLVEDSIHWVFTVPVISNDAAKQLMTDVIVEAGLQMYLFTIVPEPEAISVLCRYIPVEKQCGPDTKSFANLQTGEKYMVLDIGGETIQITVLELLSNGDLRELYAECDVGMGGTNVDKGYEAFLSEIFGANVITKFKNKYTEDYIVMSRDFELKKRSTAPDQNTKFVFRIPMTLFEIQQHTYRRPLEECIDLSRYKNQIVLRSDKMIIESDILKSFFDSPLRSIFDNIKAVLAEPQVSGCSTILVVGGFAEAPMLQGHIGEHFPDKHIIIPQEAGLAVLKGAVIFGHTIFK